MYSTNQIKALHKTAQNDGIIIDTNGNLIACQFYLAALKQQCKEGVSPEAIIQQLSDQDTIGQTLGYFIASKGNPQIVVNYLDLLVYLTKYVARPRDVFNLISLKTIYQWNLGHAIARYQVDYEELLAPLKNQVHRENQCVLSFLGMLTQLMKKGIPADEMVSYLKQQSSKGVTIGHLLACNQNANTVKAYLIFLEDLLIKCRDPKAMVSLLTAKTLNHWTLIQGIARYQDADCVLRYLRLVRTLGHTLKQRGEDCEWVKLLNSSLNSACDIMLKYQSIPNLYSLICHGVFRGVEDKSKLIKKANIIFRHIMTLPYELKKRGLENATSRLHPLYTCFEKRQKKIQGELAVLNNQLSTTLVSSTATFSMSASPFILYAPLRARSPAAQAQAVSVAELRNARAP